jgi:hypothetical protein
MRRGCLTIVGVLAVIVIAIVVCFAVRGASAVKSASVNRAALAKVHVGMTRDHVDQLLGNDGSGDSLFVNGTDPRRTPLAAHRAAARLAHRHAGTVADIDTSGVTEIPHLTVDEVQPVEPAGIGDLADREVSERARAR